jgi:hypothetical protein
VTTATSSVLPRAQAQPATELCVVLACHHLICALPIRSVDRLALPAAAQPAPAPRRSRGAQVTGAVAAPAVVRFGEQSWAAWDLGVMLGVGPSQGAWVLLRAPLDGGEVALALRTGPCFAVQGVRRLSSLPPGIFSARRAALAGTFATAAVKGPRARAEVGLWLEPTRLWEPLELAASAASLREDR